MKIELLVRRPGGTVVAMPDGTEYEFRPDDDGRHVGEVDDPAHADKLLSIVEGYRRLDEPAGDTSAPVDTPKRRNRTSKARR